jgi:hypothetical protein
MVRASREYRQAPGVVGSDEDELLQFIVWMPPRLRLSAPAEQGPLETFDLHQHTFLFIR